MVAFAVALLMGTAVYFRIWARQSTDPSFTVDDREELRFVLLPLLFILLLRIGHKDLSVELKNGGNLLLFGEMDPSLGIHGRLAFEIRIDRGNWCLVGVWHWLNLRFSHLDLVASLSRPCELHSYLP